MTTELRTERRSPADGGERPDDTATAEPHRSDGRPSERKRRGLPFGRRRNGRKALANGRQKRTPTSNGQAVPAHNGRTASGVPRMHVPMLVVLVATTVITGVASLVFSYGNVRSTLIGLGWQPWLASLYTPAVDVTVIGLILVGQYLVAAGIAPERLARANRLLAAAGFAMLGANVIPSLITGYAHNQPAAYGSALANAVLPSFLIAWSHIGPYLVGLFAEIRSNAEAAARAIVDQRTDATEADRAAAAAALAEARAEAARIRSEAAEELAAAASVRQREEDAARAAERERTDAQRTLADWIARQERTTTERLSAQELATDSEATRKMRAAELLAQRAQAELSEARELAAHAHADRAAAASERDAAAADRRAAEELLAAAGTPAPPAERTRRERAPRDPDDVDQADNVTSVAGRMLIADRVAAWQKAHPEWATEPVPSQDALRAFWPGLKSADTISKVRQKLEEAKRGAA